MSNSPDYNNGYDDGYRAGLQKARDAIKEGKLFTAAQVEEMKLKPAGTADASTDAA